MALYFTRGRASRVGCRGRLDMSVLFAATGPIQEVSLSSGWDDAFLKIAEQFDRAEQRAYGTAAAG